MENICAGDSYSSEQVAKAIDVSYSKEFVDVLPEKLHTMIGDRGMRLSGGQAQRITIARAFLKDCPILLFDEATSALDNESERVVQRALDEVAGHKTVVAIAHRLSTIQGFDQIVVMKSGKIIEQGSHSELINNNSEYKKLYELSL
jgi:subfamily B ATP-binding cassette protein MsbA